MIGNRASVSVNAASECGWLGGGMIRPRMVGLVSELNTNVAIVVKQTHVKLGESDSKVV